MPNLLIKKMDIATLQMVLKILNKELFRKAKPRESIFLP
jgi:hypothetical protein